MERRIINPWKWQDEFGYVQANEVQNTQRTLYCSGQAANDAEGRAMHPGDMRAQITLALDNLEILFDTGLEVEPLRLLQVSSRNRTIVASWNGSFQAGTLTYAEPGHPEFIQFKQTEAVVITVGTSANN